MVANVVMMPETAPLSSNGYFTREWVYYFNELGRVSDKTIDADLPSLNQNIANLNTLSTNVPATIQSGIHLTDLEMTLLAQVSNLKQQLNSQKMWNL